MPVLSIPEQFQPGLARLRDVSEETALQLFASLEAASRECSSDSLSAEELRSVAGLSSSDAQTILNCLTFLYRVRASSDATVPEFVTDVCDAMRYGVGSRYRLSEESLPSFRERMTKFLSLEAMNVLSKAVNLRYEHEHSLCNARILTDARPVFGGDPGARPQCVVIFHMLKVAYHEPTSLREIYFALDESDLAELGDLIERAKKKAKSLHQIFESANIRVIDPE